jgi:Lanthionine synthetase C-like protein.
MTSRVIGSSANSPLPIADPLTSARLRMTARIAEALLDEAPLPARSAAKALLFAQLHGTTGEQGWRQAAVRHLNIAIARADELCSTKQWGLHGGLAGLGWAVEVVSRMLGVCDDLNGDSDAALLRELERGRWQGSFDAGSGLAGIGIYFLERKHEAGIRLVIDHLESQLDRARLARGVMFLLAQVASPSILERVLDAVPFASAVTWLRCARITGRDQDYQVAARLLEEAYAVSPETVADASLRRGAAGMAQMFAQIDEQRANVWRERTLSILERGEWTPDSDGDCLMDGEAGVALALMNVNVGIVAM